MAYEKGVTEADEYEFTLNQHFKEVAERELRETDELRDFSIKAMRDWIMQNPRIEKCRMDSMWILKHLRFRKFSLPLAQEAMERHLVLRQGTYGKKFFHQDMDLLRPGHTKICDDHPVCILQDRDKLGRKVLLIKPSLMSLGGKDLGKDVLTMLQIMLETISEIEEVQIKGIVYIFDVSGMSLEHLTVLPIESWAKIGKNAEKDLTLRHKAFIAVNVPSALSFLINLALKNMSEKLQTRVKIYKNFDEFDYMDKKSLPKEYGGTIPYKEMAAPLYDLMLAKRPIHLKYQEMRVNGQMYPKACLDGSLDMLNVPLNSPDLFERASRCSDDTLYGIQGSFRKLELD